MTTTLRPTGPLQQGADGAKARVYDVCVNSRPVGAVEIGTEPGLGSGAGRIGSLRINEPDRRRGRGTVAALAAEEALRGWGCTQVMVSVAADNEIALRMAASLGYTERSRNMLKKLPSHLPGLPATVEGRPMSEAEFQRWLSRATDDYAQSWIDRGVPEAQARAKSQADHARNLPDGLATPGSRMSVLVADGTVVGHVWVAERPALPDAPGAYVYDVEVAEAYRGRGYGRALMLLAERVARELGAEQLGLHVFAGNTPAIRLYESSGYATTQLNLAKDLL